MCIHPSVAVAIGFMLTFVATVKADTLEERILLRDSLKMFEELGCQVNQTPTTLYFDSGRDNITIHRELRSLPEGLRLALEDNPDAIDDPASAQEPSNLREPMIHPEAIVKSLQESIDRLSAAGLKAEAAEAAQLLKKFEQNHQVRLLMERQDADFAKHRSALDRLQRRLGQFDIDIELERRLTLAAKLRAYEVTFPPMMNSHSIDDGRDNLRSPRERSLNHFGEWR
ncbi:MAG: hypothetical protein JWP89_2437 [Schlesneria sp.]|nr:hypothetical protein [Schlesneria sp.]